MHEQDLESAFFGLTPEQVLTASEAYGPRATGRFSILPSYENRVYQIELEEPLTYQVGESSFETSWIVGKFYRPGRWSKDALLEEHDVCRALVEAEVPTVPWLPLKDSATTLGQTSDQIFFGFTPRVFGRSEQEPNPAQMEWLGRLMARMHSVLKTKPFKHRTAFGEPALQKSVNHLLGARWLKSDQETRLAQVFSELKPELDRVLKKFPIQSIHGDCHFGNILWNASGPFFLDFDDAMVGPIAQDLWLIMDAPVDRGLEHLARGYESFSEWVEISKMDVGVFRAYRMLTYAGWVAARFRDPAFQRVYSHYSESGTWDRWFEDYARVWEQIRVF